MKRATAAGSLLGASLVKLSRLEHNLGIGRATVYRRISEGLLPPAIPGAGHAKRALWPSYEIERVMAAQIAGKSDDEMRQLVKQMVKRRATLLDEVSKEARG